MSLFEHKENERGKYEGSDGGEKEMEERRERETKSWRERKMVRDGESAVGEKVSKARRERDFGEKRKRIKRKRNSLFSKKISGKPYFAS